MLDNKIDPSSPTPLYAQIASSLRLKIAIGEVRPGSALSSVRHLAQELHVNPATVVRAYRELEADGLLELRQGAGTFVKQLAADQRERVRERRATHIVRGMLVDANRLGLSLSDIRLAISEVMGESS